MPNMLMEAIMAFNVKTRSAAAGLAVLMTLGATGAQAAPHLSLAAPSVAQAGDVASDFTQVRNRHRYYRHRHHGGSALGAGIALGTLGLIAGAAAADRYYDYPSYYYRDDYPPAPVYRYYQPPRYYYAPPPRVYYYGY
jgi:hypothetical protein